MHCRPLLIILPHLHSTGKEYYLLFVFEDKEVDLKFFVLNLRHELSAEVKTVVLEIADGYSKEVVTVCHGDCSVAACAKKPVSNKRLGHCSQYVLKSTLVRVNGVMLSNVETDDTKC